MPDFSIDYIEIPTGGFTAKTSSFLWSEFKNILAIRAKKKFHNHCFGVNKTIRPLIFLDAS